MFETGMGNFRINPDFRIENFPIKHEISLVNLFVHKTILLCQKQLFGLIYA